MLVEVLTEGFSGAPTRMNLDVWVMTQSLSLTTLMDRSTRRAFMVLGRREISYVVDLRTMRIVRKVQGDTSGATSTATLNAAVDQMLTLLRM